MKKILLSLVIIVFVILGACSNNYSDVDLDRSPSNDISVPEINFTYKEFIPEQDDDLYFSPWYAISNNYLIYSSEVNDQVRYGFMDIDFNKVSDPIHNAPPIFYNGLAGAYADGEYVVYDENMIRLDVDGNMPFNYKGEWFYKEFFRLFCKTIDEDEGHWYWVFTRNKYKNVNITETLIPVQATTGLYGYKPFEDVYVNEVPGDEGYQIPPIYERAYNFSEGLAAVMMDEKLGYINTDGKLIIDCQYTQARDFSKGIAQVGQRDAGAIDEYSLSLIDTSGNAVSDSKYVIIRDFREGFASAGKANTNTINGGVIIDENGKEYFSGQFRKAWGYVDGISLVQTSYGEYYYIDKNGYNINGEKYVNANEFSDGLAVVAKKDTYGYIGTDGLYKIEPIYEYATNFNSGFAVVRLPGESLSYVIDKMGNLYLEELDLDRLSMFTEDGYALGYSEVDDEGNRIYYLIYMN